MNSLKVAGQYQPQSKPVPSYWKPHLGFSDGHWDRKVEPELALFEAVTQGWTDAAIVYVIGTMPNGMVKVGVTGRPHQRLAEIRQAVRIPNLTYLHWWPLDSREAAFKAEASAHAALRLRFVCVREWFRCAPHEADDAIEAHLLKGA